MIRKKIEQFADMPLWCNTRINVPNTSIQYSLISALEKQSKFYKKGERMYRRNLKNVKFEAKRAK